MNIHPRGRFFFLVLLLLVARVREIEAGHFTNLGIPVRSALLMDATIGEDEKSDEVLYFNCAQDGNRLFLLQVNPLTGQTRQFDAPIGDGAWAMLVAPDHSLYLGTWEGGYILKLDPHQ